MQKFLECTDTLHFLRSRSMVPVPKNYFKRRQFQISWADNCLGSQLVTICTVASRLRRQSPILISILLGSLPYPTRCRISEDALPVVTDGGGVFGHISDFWSSVGKKMHFSYCGQQFDMSGLQPLVAKHMLGRSLNSHCAHSG